MAEPGYYKRIQSSHPQLEIKRAGAEHICGGVWVERGQRPGIYAEAWMLARTKRCERTIQKDRYYIANRILPKFWNVPNEMWTPLCLHCAVEVYPEYLDGELKYAILRPLTPERKEEIRRGLVAIVEEP